MLSAWVKLFHLFQLPAFWDLLRNNSKRSTFPSSIWKVNCPYSQAFGTTAGRREVWITGWKHKIQEVTSHLKITHDHSGEAPVRMEELLHVRTLLWSHGAHTCSPTGQVSRRGCKCDRSLSTTTTHLLPWVIFCTVSTPPIPNSSSKGASVCVVCNKHVPKHSGVNTSLGFGKPQAGL